MTEEEEQQQQEDKNNKTARASLRSKIKHFEIKGQLLAKLKKKFLITKKT